MAKLFLESTDTSYKVSNSNTQIFGATGDQAVVIDGALTGITINSNVERVQFTGATTDYTYKVVGNQLEVYKAGALVTTVGVQPDANGTQLTFANGTVDAKITGLNAATVGGKAVSATQPAPVENPTIDTTTAPTVAFTLASNAVAGTPTVEGQTLDFTVTPSAVVAADTTVNISIGGEAFGGISKTTDTVDFNNVFGSLKFVAGSSAPLHFMATISNDGIPEGPEAYKVKLLDSSYNQLQAIQGIITDGVTVETGSTFTLTSGIDNRTGTAGDDTFDGSVNAQGTATLTSVDKLDGGNGNDILIAEMTGNTVAPTIKNIEALELVSSSGTNVFNVINVANSPSLLVRNGAVALTIDSYTGNAVSLRDQNANLTINETNAAATGANTFTVSLSGAQKNATGNANGPTVALTQMSGTDASGIETVALVSEGTNTNYLTALTSVNGSNTSKIAALNVSGAQGLVINTALNASVKTLDASKTTGGVSVSFAAADKVTLTGGTGADVLGLTANTSDVSVVAGEGNDVVSFNGTSTFTTTDTVAGGDGTADRLDVLAASAEAITAALTNTTGFEQLSLNTIATAVASINATRFGSIDTVSLTKGIAGAYGVTLAAGTQRLNFASTNETLGGALTVTDTGTATSDVLTIANSNATSATNNFNNQNITSAGFETVTINTGAVNVAMAQTIGTITMQADASNVPVILNFAGANAVTIAAPSSNSSALFTIDASGMTAQATGTNTFTTAAPVFAGVTGTVSINGSAGDDVLVGHTTVANTIAGGEGADAITGGAAADLLKGDAGKDTITGGGGNDTITGGDGNDSITVTTGTVNVDAGAGDDTVNVAATLTAGDTVVGGEGSDTLLVSTAAVTASLAAGVSGFETLTFDATGGATQDMVQFQNNSGFTRLNLGSTAGNTLAFSNVGASVATLGLPDVAVTGATITRLVNTANDALSIQIAATAARTVTALSIANEDTVSIATGTNALGDLTITTLTADSIKSLTITGAGDVTIGTLANAASLATINAVAATGTVSVNAATSVVNMTVTGALAAGNTITGGTGSDTMVGGDVADSLTGGNGADNISGGGGADALLGGIGADVINGGIGADTITGGAGNDTLTGGDGADVFTFTAITEGVDSITDFATLTDKVDVTEAISNVTVTTAAVQGAMAAANSYFISTNGAAANLTTAGAATLSAADLTATTLTNLATYLSERFTVANGVQNDVLAINWTAGGNVSTYLYDLTTAAGNTTIDAAELTLLGVVTHAADAVLVAGDLM